MVINTIDKYGRLRSYETIDHMPSGYVVWNIGENMGDDHYIPICMKNSEDLVNEDTVKVIRLSTEDVAVLRASAKYGIIDAGTARKAMNGNASNERAKALAPLALKVFSRISKTPKRTEVTVTMEKTVRVQRTFYATEEEMLAVEDGQNPFHDEMIKEMAEQEELFLRGKDYDADVEYDYCIMDNEHNKMLVDWD